MKTITAQKRRMLRGADVLMSALLKEGVDTIFGYPGGAIMPVYDALYFVRNKIRHILVRHEQGAAHAAEGYARVTGKPGVCLATSGPGATNLITGLQDALMDSVPLVCITGQVPYAAVGSDAFQEADVIGLTATCTKWNYMVTSADEVSGVIVKAFHVARSGRPGPVLIDITKNAQVELTASSHRNGVHHGSRSFAPTKTILNRAARLLNGAKRPLALAGHGVIISGAYRELRDLSEKQNIPVACTLLGLSSIPVTHPNYVGMLGMHGNYAPNKLTNKADVICAIGMRFDDRVTGRLNAYAPQAKVIHVDIDATEINKNVNAYVGIHSDAKNALKALLPELVVKKNEMWFGEFKRLYEQEYFNVIKNDLYPLGAGIRMAEVMRNLSEITRGRATIVADVGQHQMVAARYYRYQKPNSFITSGGLGTMGFALPAAMGVAVADKDRDVVAVIGDGSFQMTIQELGTIAQERLPVKVVIMNNNYLGMVRQWQELFFERRYSFVELKNPNFIKVCGGFGVDGEKVYRRSGLLPALERMLNSEGPYVLDVSVVKDENVFPMIPAGASVDEVRLK